MQVGQQLGPFLIEKQLGTGAMGAVYRGVYTKTGMKVAIKIMAPNLGGDDRALKRFEREAEILKQLKHPNIVRYYGIGKHQGTRYYAMEYVEGESLDRRMARGDRMTWEEVVTLGQQLCAALLHSHQQGIIHRDLKPSNLMILPDSTLKLTDFGIAKDIDRTQLTEANCTVGTAAYMSPEQCKGERDLTSKSDLYSLGIVFYELLTGRKPFTADNAMQMFVQHVQGEFVRPAKLVLDIPVWLDNLVCQLMEKKPEHRPMNAEMVANALATIQEKVEAQLSAGVDVARRRRVDRPKDDTARMTEEDKDTARALLGKSKKVKKKKKGRFYETVWFQAAGVVVLLLALAGTLYFLLRPPSTETLYAQAQKLMASKNLEDLEQARDGPIKTYLEHYSADPGPKTQQMRQWLTDIEFKQDEQLLHNYLAKKKGPLKVQYQSDAEKDGFAAIDAEEDGDLKKAKELWQAMADKYIAGSGYTRWGQLAKEHLKGLQEIENREKSLRNRYENVTQLGGDPPMKDDQEKEFFSAFRYVWFGKPKEPGKPDKPGDPYMAQVKFEELKKKYADKPEQRSWYLLASARDQDMKAYLKKNPDAQKNRTAAVKERLDEAKQSKEREKIKGICKNIIALYGGEDDMKELVKQAEERLKQVQ